MTKSMRYRFADIGGQIAEMRLHVLRLEIAEHHEA